MTNFQLLGQLHNCGEAIKAASNPTHLLKWGRGVRVRGRKFVNTLKCFGHSSI